MSADGLQIASYFAFTASTVLYIYVIQNRLRSSENFTEYLSAATQCQSQIFSVAEKGSLPERYCLLLEELRREATRERAPSRRLAAGAQSPFGSVQDGLQSHSVVAGNPFTAASPVELNGSLFTDTANGLDGLLMGGTPDYGEWDQFASMVSSGLGNLDGFFCDQYNGQAPS